MEISNQKGYLLVLMCIFVFASALTLNALVLLVQPTLHQHKQYGQYLILERAANTYMRQATIDRYFGNRYNSRKFNDSALGRQRIDGELSICSYLSGRSNNQPGESIMVWSSPDTTPQPSLDNIDNGGFCANFSSSKAGVFNSNGNIAINDEPAVARIAFQTPEKLLQLGMQYGVRGYPIEIYVLAFIPTLDKATQINNCMRTRMVHPVVPQGVIATSNADQSAGDCLSSIGIPNLVKKMIIAPQL